MGSDGINLNKYKKLINEVWNNIDNLVFVGKITFDQITSSWECVLQDLNAGFEKNTGYSKQSFVNKKFNSLFPSAKQDDLDKICLKITEGKTFTDTFLTDDKCYQMIVLSIDEDYRFLALITDVTDKANLESIFKQAYEQNSEDLIDIKIIEKFFSINPDLMCIANIKGYFVRLNDAWKKTLGYELEELINHKYTDFIHPDDIGYTIIEMDDMIRNNRPQIKFVNRYRAKDGSYRYLEWHSYPYSDLVYAIARDITEQRKADEINRVTEEIYRLITENSSDMIWILDTKNLKYKYVSSSVNKLLGYTKEEMTSQDMRLTLTQKSAVELIEKINKRLENFIHTKNNEIYYLDLFQHVHKNGELVWVEVSTKFRYNKNEIELLGVTSNINDRKKAEQEIQYLSNHDKLTGTFNRHYFDKVIDEELARSERYNEKLSLAMIDLDHFKKVNDKWGHPVGDEVLIKTTKAIQSTIRNTDILCRYGGEEFILILPNTNKDGAIAAAEKIRKTIEKTPLPYNIKQTVSIGVAEKFKAESYQCLYWRTDAALYLAKQTGRNRVMASEGNENIPSTISYFYWREEWESGNETIDKQHKEINEISSKLIGSVLSNQKKSEVLHLLDNALLYIKDHFKQEESILEEIGYPDLEGHKKIHNELLNKTYDLRTSYINKEINSLELFDFIVDDLVVGHLHTADTRLFKYFKVDKQ